MLTLYSKETTSFSTLGIGVLRDFISHPLITEELNGAYTLEFEYAKDGYLSEYLIEQNIVKADGQAFRIWNIKKDMQKITVFAKHIFFDLSFNFLADVFPTNLTAQSALAWMLNRAAVATNFSATGNCTQTASTRYVRKNFIDAVFNEDNALLKKFGGELSYDNFNITVHEHRGTNANFSIRYKKNLTGIDFNLDFSNVATRIVPIGFDGLTIDSTYVESPRAGNYFTPLYKTYEFNDIKYDPDDEEAYHTLSEAKQALINAANDLFTKNVDLPQVSISVNFVELSKCSEYTSYSNLETVHLGDTIDVIIPELNIHTSARVNKTVYDCILGRFITLEIGSTKQSIARTQIVIENQIRKSENYLTQAQQNAENLINHPFNGNVYIDKENGVIYLMDSTSPATAQNVWKWSLGGLGFSSTGINGTYRVAILQDGRINADFITTGQLNTGVIQGYDSLLIQVDTLDREFQKEINPTDTSSGSSIYLEDSAEAELIDFELEGKTTQETRSGKNLLNATNITDRTVSGVTITNDNGVITFNGTATEAISLQFSYFINNLPIGDYYYSMFASGSVSRNIANIIYGRNTGGNANVIMQYNATNGGKGFTNSTSYDNTNLWLYINSGTVFDNYTIKPQLESGTVATYWEQYGAMPSPDYPSELVSVGYENYFEAEYLQTTANTNINANLYKDTYTLSLENKENFGGVIYIQLYKNNTLITTNGHLLNTSSAVSFSSSSYWYYFSNIPNGNKLTFTLDDDYSLKIALSNATGSQKAFLVKDTQQHSYIPYGKYGIEVKNIGKNLISNTNKVGNTLYFNNALNQDYYIFKAGTYTISFKSTTTPSIYKRTATTNATSLGTTNPITITSNEDFNLWLYRSGMVEGEITDIQLEQGTQATEYEAYKENSQLYTLDEPLRSIGDTKDLLYIKNGMLYVDRKIGSVILNGNENWVKANEGYYIRTNDIGINIKNKSELLSNYFKNYTIIADLLANESGISMPYNNIFQLYIRYLTINTVVDFKSWLSTHNTEVQYVLAEPYTEEIGEVQIPSTYKGITYINTTDELESNMNITYVRDTLIANYVESHVSELKINEQGIEARVQTIEESDYGSKINRLESSITSQEARLDILSTNIDTTTGEVREVTTSNGLKFNSQGLNLYTGQDSYNTLINNVGTYYKDGDNVISETTKDGFMATNSKNKGQHSYSYDETNDLYEFIDERVEADGEYCYATFYNGEE